MLRRRGGSEAGAETLELVAGLPLLAMVAVLALQGVVLERQQVEVEADAREVGRAAVVCGQVLSAEARLRQVDPAASQRGATVQLERLSQSRLTRTTVSLAPQVLLAGLGPALSGLRPRASVTMRDEPC